MKSWSREDIRRVGHQVVDLVADHLSSLPDEPAFRPVPPDIIERVQSSPAPAHGASADEVLREFSETIAPYPFGNGHPRFWGWVNSPPAVMGVFADALAAAMNPSCAGGNHAAIYVERQVIQWFRDMLGFPDTSMGLLVSGGSMATLTALAVARHVKSGVNVRAKGLRETPAPFAFYMTTEGHTCARKAIELLGFGSESIRTIPTDDDYRMRVDALAAAIADDRARGVTPIAVVATAGTTNTGAIDDVEAIALVCRQHGIWLHVDAAYGGPAVLTAEYGSRLLRAFAHVDSVALDPHKWMFVPVEAGFVIVRDAEAMRAAFSLVPPYIRSAGSPTGVYGLPWFSEYGFQQTRGFRALKVWMTIKHAGLDGLKSAIEDNIALARYLAERIRTSLTLELIASGLSVVCFRYVGGGSAALQGCRDEPALATLNRAILDRLQLGGDVFITSTELKGRFVLRACVVNYRSTRDDIDRLVDAVCTIGSAVTESEL
ncbi:MAG: aminotransferase class V-fold PLP-dependent enzyme [Acidobacteria bacterium]|nr:aminotransferase class V-fold PLP-dependent enzyme [Acidobacteriota bacterium]